MKKNVKKVLATALVAGMSVAAFAGCTATPKTSSMTDVMNIASELDSYSYSYKCSVTEGDETIDVEMYGKCTEEAITMSVKVESDSEYMEMDYDAKDVLIATKDALYVNLAEIEDEFLDGMDLGTYGLDAEWIKLDYGMEVEFSDTTASFGTMFEAFEDAYGDMIEEEDGEYVLTIDDNDSAQEFLELTADMIDENKADWADLMVSSYESFDYETFLSNFMNSLFMEINKTFDLGMSSSEIKSGVEDVLAEIDFEELTSEMDASYYEDMLTDTAEELRYAAEEVDFEEGDGEIEIKAYQDGKEYVTSATVEYEDDYDSFSMEYEYKIVSEKVEIEIPEDDVMTVEEAICAVLEMFGGDIYAEDVEDLIDELEGAVDLDDLDDLMDYDDLNGSDYDDWYDEDYWDEEW